MSKEGRKFIYDLIDIKTGEYIATMEEWISKYSSKRHYDVGDKIPVPDALLFKNNSLRLRNCIVEKTLVEEERFAIYLRITEQEIKPFGIIDFSKAKKFFIKNIDWSEIDGWLN